MALNYVWAPDRTKAAEHLTRQELVKLSAEMRRRADACVDEKEQKRLFRLAVGLQQHPALTKALAELKSHPEIAQTPEDFDADDWLLNTPGGIVDLRTGELRRPDPAALCAKAVAVRPVSQPPARWLQFIAETTAGDEELAHYLQKLVGYALTGSTQEQILAFIHGPPLTGKSVFIDTLAGVFGSYHESAAADTFASARVDRHPADLAKLAGARLVTAVETQEGRAWDTQRIKMLTGGDRVAARFMRMDFFTYRPRYQIIIVGNHEPEVKGVDDAVMRRLHVIPFEHRPDTIDRLLADKLKEEWGSILQWAIDGCQMWLKEGLEPPEVVRRRTAEYRHEEDPVGLFLEECCIIDPQESVTRRALYNAWLQWCRGQGEDPGTLKTLRRRFKSKEAEFGFQDARIMDNGKHRRGYTGLGLQEEEEGF